MKNILITECLQNDFIKPVPVGMDLPNLLHIGYEESRRLVGEDIANGPVGSFMQWANATKDLHIIHIRDWHDASDRTHKAHLEQFGHHCLQNTHGAEFIFDFLPKAGVTVIDSSTLNDFEGTALDATLRVYEDLPVRVGIIGVWTEAKIIFLAYELSTRYPNFTIAVCSALTASSSRSQHFFALKQLERIIGVTVIDSVGEFIAFLGGSNTALSQNVFNKNLNISIEKNYTISNSDENIIRYLFRDCRSVSLRVLDGGFSGNLVAGVISHDLRGHEQARHVIKVGDSVSMAKERTAFEQIEMVLGNSAPAIVGHADFEGRGAIKYRYASVGDGRVSTLQQQVQSGMNVNNIVGYLREVFVNQLGRLYRASVDDATDLLAYYEFSSFWADSVKSKIESLLGSYPYDENILLPSNVAVENLYRFYRHDLNKIKGLIGDFPFSFVHGDLNGANVIIDSNNNVWLIDFFHTHHGHVLKDFAKLENDILYIYTPIISDIDLLTAYSFSDFLIGQKNQYELIQKLPVEFRNTIFEKTYRIIREIRKLAGEYIKPYHQYKRLQWHIPQLRYAVHTLGFEEATHNQKMWALYSACQLSSAVKEEIVGDT